MRKKRFNIFTGWCSQVLGVALLICFAASPVMSAEGIDPDADKILRSMSSYLGEAPVFSMNADIDNEIITNDGQKLQLSSFAKIVVERPDKLHMQRMGMFGEVRIIFDGKTLTLYGKNLNVYIQREVSGTVDNAIRAVEIETGLDAPAADLLFADPYAILSSGVVSGVYLGTAYINGVECHHLAFRKAKVDWQLWVQAGDTPLPMKYIITTKWLTGAPQYEIRFREWNMEPKIKDSQFTFSVPKGARKVETIPVNEMGELIQEEGK